MSSTTKKENAAQVGENSTATTASTITPGADVVPEQVNGHVRMGNPQALEQAKAAAAARQAAKLQDEPTGAQAQTE